MIVRAARAADIAAMAEATARSYAQGFASILEPSALAARDAAFFAQRFAEAWPRMRVAEEDDRVLGVSLVTDAHLDMLFVDPAAIGRGAGSALLREAEARGVRTLECFRDNRAARDFYERHGWRKTDAYERDFIGRQRAFVAYEKNCEA